MRRYPNRKAYRGILGQTDGTQCLYNHYQLVPLRLYLDVSRSIILSTVFDMLLALETALLTGQPIRY